MNNPFLVALKAKGLSNLFHRSRSIVQCYGFTSGKMDYAIHNFLEVLRRFDCGATLPITATILKRHSGLAVKYLNNNIEFAVHGYTHIDYSLLAPETQLAHLRSARKVFTQKGITPMGFRPPYLRCGDYLNAAIEEAGFSYVSSQPILWDVLDQNVSDPLAIASYERALAFYNPWRDGERPSLPTFKHHLVEIPVSLPDDEILIERLGGAEELIENTWQCILSKTYQRGELFTLQLHPERIALCVDSLASVLAKARALAPAVWCARLDEITAWWKARAEATIEVSQAEDERYHCIIQGPVGITVLARAVEVDAPSLPWANGYREVKATRFTFKSPFLPLIGLSPSTSRSLAHFLRQQGYFLEIGRERERYMYYIDQDTFDSCQEYSILAQIEGSGRPLLRLGRWPNGAQSALAVTGDIDALSLWDYGLRIVGK